ncbi:DNA oxidative demethylase ALKBH2 [Olea europaea subsp. europaea]|uniref:DNA oxidative demethylase ALKBH2 n=1 Tax=Olea europaea subsp. europaea TaxID=158383 RepID=A0A8S0S9W6_OLEEU|nr:DNA oxidative demethylase ALKBH2 [Olea europaea subsp. europaea]
MEAKFCTHQSFCLTKIPGIISITLIRTSLGPDPQSVYSDAPVSRDTCYVASEGFPNLIYSGYQPHAYSWDEFPPLKEILDLVHKALPGSKFNSLLLNRYKGGNDHVGWHADDEKLYGLTPEIASVSFGCERDFFLKKKPSKTVHAKENGGDPPGKRTKKNNDSDQRSFVLKHGSLLVMRGYTQRDWVHSVPKRVKAAAVRINLTFRLIC